MFVCRDPNDRSFKHNQVQVFHIIDKEEFMKSETVSRNAKNIMQIFLVYIEIVLE